MPKFKIIYEDTRDKTRRTLEIHHSTAYKAYEKARSGDIKIQGYNPSKISAMVDEKGNFYLYSSMYRKR
jgi:hypothetical protein